MRFLGIDLAWREASEEQLAPDTGVLALEADGTIVEAGWTSGVDATVEWIESCSKADTLVFVDAPLIVENSTGQRLCEKHVGKRYWPWNVSANSTNTSTRRLAGVALRQILEGRGWRYSDGADGPPASGRVVSECYPYTTLVGVNELGYEDERPRFKRKPRRLLANEWRPRRAATCDDLIGRLDTLTLADPPLVLSSHPETARLIEESSPLADGGYKRREDLIDAAICAWTASLWRRHGHVRCQVLGVEAGVRSNGCLPTIIAPCRDEQRAHV